MKPLIGKSVGELNTKTLSLNMIPNTSLIFQLTVRPVRPLRLVRPGQTRGVEYAAKVWAPTATSAAASAK